ncbi:hypothetical protein BU17DRAFT_100179 [Hysterangium stoloniferum]|nr:hypothetical protein BU17DRAFT_100179 [Hysterangium stoloniferum]
MGRHSKATLACISNLGHPQKKFQACVEDITDPQDPYFDGSRPQNHPVDLLEEGFFMLDEDLGSDSEDEIDDEECEDETTDKVVTDTDIARFTKRLAEAQLAAVKAERVTMAEKKLNRKCHYTGNSKRTKQHHAQKQRKLGETGQQFIQSFFKQKTMIASVETMPSAPKINRDVEPEVLEVDSEDEDEETAVEIVAESGEEHLRRLFPEDDNIQASGITELEASSVPPMKSEKEQVENILREMKEAKCHQETIPETPTDNLLNGLSYKDFPALCRARARLNIES